MCIDELNPINFPKDIKRKGKEGNFGSYMSISYFLDICLDRYTLDAINLRQTNISNDKH